LTICSSYVLYKREEKDKEQMSEIHAQESEMNQGAEEPDEDVTEILRRLEADAAEAKARRAREEPESILDQPYRESTGHVPPIEDQMKIRRDPRLALPGIPEIQNSNCTEFLLNGLIAECHLLMREVALGSMCATNDAHVRAQFMDSAMALARTGAQIAQTVGHLRSGHTGEDRKHVTMEHIIRREGGEGVPAAEKQ
jgi:hypothetical protein